MVVDHDVDKNHYSGCLPDDVLLEVREVLAANRRK